jgi:NADP-dependent 3-hydroxy acid dehydrogenase YdfG
MNVKGQTWWLVGASEGLGRALAARMTKAGAHVIASGRDQTRLNELLADGGASEILVVDATSVASLEAAAAKLPELDGVIWLAGTYWPMAAQEYDTEKVLTMFDVNTIGLVRVLGVVLPKMVARDKGRIVITGSLSGYRGLPGSVGYSASKAAVMHLAEDLHADLRGTGIRVQLAVPGFIKTRLTAKNDFKMPQIMEPEAAAAEVMTLIDSQAFSRAFPRPFAWVFRLGNFLPDWLYYRVFARKSERRAKPVAK